MTKSLVVGSAQAIPGEVSTGCVQVSSGLVSFEIPVTVVCGREEGPVLGVTAGVHGCEYCAVLGALKLARRLRPDELRGAVVVACPINVPGFYARTPYTNPLDGKNVNRVFPGSMQGTISEVLGATVVEQILSRVDAVVDMHGGDLIEDLIPFSIVPSSGDAGTDRKSEDMARAFGLDPVVRGGTGGTLTAAATRMGKPAIVAEAGGMGAVDEQAVDLHYRGARRVMSYLGMLEEHFEPVPSPMLNIRALRSPATGLLRTLVLPGAEVRAGQVLAEITDVFGRVLAEVAAPVEGRLLYIVRSPLTNEGEPMAGLAVPA